MSIFETKTYTKRISTLFQLLKQNNDSFFTRNIYIPPALPIDTTTEEISNIHRDRSETQHINGNDGSDSSLSSRSAISTSSAQSLNRKDRDLIKTILNAANRTVSEKNKRYDNTMKYNIVQITKQFVWKNTKFLTDNTIRTMDVTGDPVPNNILGVLLTQTIQESMSIVDRITFWKKWGVEVKKTINDLKTSTSRQIKSDIIVGKKMYILFYISLSKLSNHNFTYNCLFV